MTWSKYNTRHLGPSHEELPEDTEDPKTMEATAIQIGEGIHVIKTLVAVGHGGCGHLTHSGLRARFLLNLEKAPDTIDTLLTEDHCTTPEMVAEEQLFIEAVRRDDVKRFEIDTSMTVICLDDVSGMDRVGGVGGAGDDPSSFYMLLFDRGPVPIALL